MLILALDTSSPAGSLAALSDTRIVGVISTCTEETYSSRLFRHLDFLQRELNLELSLVELFAVVVGPGSFTGLRVGLSAVKGWAEVYGRPVAAISALEAVAAQASSTDPLIVPLLDARRGQVYGAVYRRVGEGVVLEGEERVMTPLEFLDALAVEVGSTPFAFACPVPEIITPAVEHSRFASRVIKRVSTVLAPIVGRLGYERARRGQLVDALHLEANYIRRSDAELLWKGN